MGLSRRLRVTKLTKYLDDFQVCRGFFVISSTPAKMASEGLIMIFLEVFVKQRTVFEPKADSANGYIV